MTGSRQKLIEHISEEAVFHGDFVLASGLRASYYVDLRKISLDHRVAPLIGEVMLELIAGIADVSAVGGMTMGADPIASAILHHGALRRLAYDAFVVRKEPKDHGRGRQVEGPDLSGRRVVVLEDTSTTGASPLAAIDALLAVGAKIAAVAVVVDRNTGARERIEAAGYPYLAAIGLADLGLPDQDPVDQDPVGQDSVGQDPVGQGSVGQGLADPGPAGRAPTDPDAAAPADSRMSQ